MWESILEFNRKNFYQEKVARVGTAVREYDKARGTPQHETARQQAEETILTMLKENGSIDGNIECLALEKEFFSGEGLLDDAKLERFQKEIVKNYSAEQIRWCFAGTTSCYTPITLRALEKNNTVYQDLLPQGLKQEYNAGQKHKLMPPDPARYQVYLYPDSTLAEEIIPGKKRIAFDMLADDSGFDWTKGYSPDNVVQKANWTAGFNSANEWEKVWLMNAPGYCPGVETNPAELLTESKIDEGLGIIAFKDFIFLFDNLSLLMQGEEQTYYSLGGEVYAHKTLDKARTLENLKRKLALLPARKLKGIVIRNTSQEALDWYTKELADYITPETVFYGRTDEKLKEELLVLKERIAETEISAEITGELLAPGKAVLTGADLLHKLIPSTVEEDYPIPLQVFDPKEDMLTLLSLPVVADQIDEETAGYLRGMEVPPGKREALSNALQNVLFNYKTLFKGLGIPGREIIKGVERIINSGETDKMFEKEKIVTEKNLFDLIQQKSVLYPAITDIPEFTSLPKKADDYADIFDRDGFNGWTGSLLESGISNEAIAAIKEQLAGLSVTVTDKPRFSRTVQNIFSHYREIAASTGMKPAEIIKSIDSVLGASPEAGSYKQKRVFFEKDFTALINEAALYNPHRIKVRKKDRYNAEKVALVWKPFAKTPNLLNQEELMFFLGSPVLSESGLEEEERSALETQLAAMVLPEEKQLAFSEGALNLIRGNRYRLKPAGIPLATAVKALGAWMVGVPSDGRQAQMNIILSLAGIIPETPDKESETILVSMFDGYEQFKTAALASAGELPEDEVQALYRYASNAKLPADRKNLFAGSIARILTRYRKGQVPAEFSLLKIVQAAAGALRGKRSAIPVPLKPFLSEIIESKAGSQLPVVNLFDPESRQVFMQAPALQQYQLNPQQWETLLTAHKKAFKGKQKEFYQSIPVTYRDVPAVSDISKQQAVSPLSKQQAGSSLSKQQAVSPLAKLREELNPNHPEPNTLLNLGWIEKEGDHTPRRILLTHQGNRVFTPEVKVKITGREQSADTPETRLAPVRIQIQSIGNETGSQSFFAHPAHYLKQGKKALQPSHTPQQRHYSDTTGTGNSNRQHEETDKLKRMEENYLQDKQMLARSASHSPLTGDISGNKNKKDDDNIIRKFAEDVFNDIKNNMES